MQRQGGGGGGAAASSGGMPVDCPELKHWYASCRAILDGSDTPCAALPQKSANCRARATCWKALAAGVSGPLAVAQGLAVECAAELPADTCEALTRAVGAQSPASCPTTPGISAWCRALSTADPAPCAGAKDCTQIAARLQVLARGGLKLCREQCTGEDVISAAAALHDPHACDALKAAIAAHACD